jgi:hypothetical protein
MIGDKQPNSNYDSRLIYSSETELSEKEKHNRLDDFYNMMRINIVNDGYATMYLEGITYLFNWEDKQYYETTDCENYNIITKEVIYKILLTFYHDTWVWVKISPSEFYLNVIYDTKDNNYKFTEYVYTDLENDTYELHKDKIILIESCDKIPQRTIIIDKKELTKRFEHIIRREKLERLKEKIN